MPMVNSRLQFKPDILSGSIWGHQVLITIRNWTLFLTYKYLSAVFKSFMFPSILLCLVSEGGCLENRPRKHRPQTADLEITSLILVLHIWWKQFTSGACFPFSGVSKNRWKTQTLKTQTSKTQTSYCIKRHRSMSIFETCIKWNQSMSNGRKRITWVALVKTRRVVKIQCCIMKLQYPNLELQCWIVELQCWIVKLHCQIVDNKDKVGNEYEKQKLNFGENITL